MCSFQKTHFRFAAKNNIEIMTDKTKDTSVWSDTLELIKELDKKDVPVKCSNCKTEKMVSKFALREALLRCKCGGVLLPVRK